MHPGHHQPTPMKYVPKVPLYRHQLKALKKLKENKGGALFMPMRSGKTAVAIHFVYLTAEYPCTALVLCPKSVIGVWNQEIDKHAPDGPVLWHVINYERLYKLVPITEGSKYKHAVPNPNLDGPWSHIICDESHKIGDPTSLQSKLAYKLGEEAKYRLIMTGTPAHRQPLKLFGQFKFLDDSVFGTSWTAFQRQFAVFGGHMNKVLLRYQNLGEMWEKIKPQTFLLKHVPVRKPIWQVRPVELVESRDAYDEMAREAFLEIQGEAATAPVVLTKGLRLAQIAGGHIRTVDKKARRVGREKRNAFSGLLEELGDSEVKKVVVFARFIPELRDIAEESLNLGYKPYLFHGKVSQRDREKRILDFHESSKPCVFVSQVATGSLGIDLSCADVAVFYSLPDSLVDFEQAAARIRKYKDRRALTYYSLQASGTIDNLMWQGLEKKRSWVEAVMKEPNLIQEG